MSKILYLFAFTFLMACKSDVPPAVPESAPVPETPKVKSEKVENAAKRNEISKQLKTIYDREKEPVSVFGSELGSGDTLEKILDAKRASDSTTPGHLATLKFDKPNVTGALDPLVVNRVARRGLRKLRRCFKNKAFKSKPKSTTIRITVLEEGDVTGVKTTADTLGNSEVEDCMINELKTWKFPAPNSSVRGRSGSPSIAIIEFAFRFTFY